MAETDYSKTNKPIDDHDVVRDYNESMAEKTQRRLDELQAKADADRALKNRNEKQKGTETEKGKGTTQENVAKSPAAFDRPDAFRQISDAEQQFPHAEHQVSDARRQVGPKAEYQVRNAEFEMKAEHPDEAIERSTDSKGRNANGKERQSAMRKLRKTVGTTAGAMAVLNQLDKANQKDSGNDKPNDPTSPDLKTERENLTKEMDKNYDFISRSVSLKNQMNDAVNIEERQAVEKNMRRLAAQEFFDADSVTPETVEQFNSLSALEVLNTAQQKVEGRLQDQEVDCKRIDKMVAAFANNEVPPKYSELDPEVAQNEANAVKYNPAQEGLLAQTGVKEDTAVGGNWSEKGFEKDASAEKIVMPDETTDERLAETSASIDEDVIKKMQERVDSLETENKELREKLQAQADTQPKTKESIRTRFRRNRDRFKESPKGQKLMKVGSKVGGALVTVGTVTATALLSGAVVVGKYGAKASLKLSQKAENMLTKGFVGGFDPSVHRHAQYHDVGR